MLDYSELSHAREGVVRFRQQSARHIPTTSGVYQVVVVPFSFASVDQTDAIASYLDFLQTQGIDWRQRFGVLLGPTRRGISIELTQLLSPSIPIVSIEDSFLRHAATFFPAFYIGQAIDLRNRFLDHIRGINSELVALLSESGLSDYATFFRWHMTAPSFLDPLESILLQAHRPVFNRQLR